MGNSLVGGGNAILLLLTGMALLGAVIIALLAARRHRPGVTRTFLGGAAILALAYGGGVIAASAASTEQTLAPGQIKWFCGFYLDCHLGVSLDRDEVVTELPTANGTVKPDGQFHILTLGLHNSAKNPNVDMLMYHPDIEIVDASGRHYQRSAAAEAALASTSRPAVLTRETTVTHDPLRATVVFDLPANVQQPRLIITEGWIVDRAIEFGLLNDENSILHKRTYQALTAADSRIASIDND